MQAELQSLLKEEVSRILRDGGNSLAAECAAISYALSFVRKIHWNEIISEELAKQTLDELIPILGNIAIITVQTYKTACLTVTVRSFKGTKTIGHISEF